MSRSCPVLPYRVLPPEGIVPSSTGWVVVAEGLPPTTLLDGSAFPYWDAKLNFRLEREFKVERDVARELRIDTDESCCEFVVTAATGGGVMRQILFREVVKAGGPSAVKVCLSPSSQHLAKELVLVSGVYLSGRFFSGDPLAPAMPGCRLWEMTERIRLEGGAARLPLYEVPFSQVFAGDRIEHAEFHVEITPDPELDIESALTVYLNSERPSFVKEASLRGSAAEHRLWNGIVRRVLTSALISDDLMSVPPGNSNSIAATVQRWSRMIWPGVVLESVGSLPASGYSRFEGQIESWLNALEPAERPDGSA